MKILAVPWIHVRIIASFHLTRLYANKKVADCSIIYDIRKDQYN